MKKSLVLVASMMALCSLATHTVAELIPKLDGQAVYDTDLNITWLADANLAASLRFDFHSDGASGGINSTGSMSWFTANEYIDRLNQVNYLGFNTWRLPSVLNPGWDTKPYPCIGFDCVDGEQGHLYYDEFGAIGGDTSVTGSWTSNSEEYAKFSNIQIASYWYAEEDVSVSHMAYLFAGSGEQRNGSKHWVYYVWPVLDGDPDPIPIDSDNDGLLDRVEDPNYNRIVDPGETDPNNPDTDNDGLLDGEEDSNHNGIIDAGETNPLDFDSDDDGLTDGYEVNISGTDPNTSTTLIPGDMNGDGEINLGDLLLLQRQLLGY